MMNSIENDLKRVKMEKNGEIFSKALLILLGVAFILFAAYFVFADNTITVYDGSTSFTDINEDMGYVYNITVNNTDLGDAANITLVSFRIPTGFNFITSSNGSDASGPFTTINSTYEINWTNDSAGIILNGSWNHFWFNATVATPGVYTLYVTTVNVTSVSSTSNISVTINDTTAPTNISFVSPVNATNVSSLTITVHSTDNFNISVFNVRVYNSTNDPITNATSPVIGASSYNYEVTFSGLPDGIYYYNATVNDTNGNVNNSVTYLSTLDATAPNVTFMAGSTVNWYNTTIVDVYINVSTFDSHGLSNLTIRIYNSTSLVNETNNATAFSFFDGFYLNVSSLRASWDDAEYTINATATDSAGNTNTTTRIFRKDTTGPQVTLSNSTVTQTSITIVAVVNDSVTSGNTVCTTDRGTVSGTTPTASSIAETGLTCGTQYSYTLTCYDILENEASGTLAVTTLACSGGGGGGGSSSSINEWTNTYVVDNVAFSAGELYTKALPVKNRIKFNVGNLEHMVGVLEIGTDSAKIVVQSDPQEAILAVGETKKFEVTSDDYYDVQVTLNSITDGKADLSVKYINEKVPEETSAGEEGATSETVPEETASSNTLWIVLVVILIVAIIVWLLMKKRR